MGFCPLAGYSIALYRAASDLDSAETNASIILKVGAGLFLVASLAISLVWFARGDRPNRRIAEGATGKLLARMGLCAILITGLVLLFGSPNRHSTWLDFPVDHVRLTRALGPVAILCLALALFTTIGSAILVLGRRWRVPLFIPVLLVPIIVNAWFPPDNHPIRRPLPRTQPPIGVWMYPDPFQAQEQFLDWEALRSVGDTHNDARGPPSFS